MANNISIDEMRKILGQSKESDTREVIAEAEMTDDGRINIYNSTLATLGKEVTEHAVKNLTPAISKTVITLVDEAADKIDKKVTKAEVKLRDEMVALANTVRPLEITYKDIKTKLEGIQHNKFDTLLKIVAVKQPVLLVGSAGTGKTHGAELVSKALGLTFHSISVGSQTSKSDLQGYMDANHNYVRTQFREAYERGGVFLLDEADAGNSNVLILLNAALSNGYMAFPDGMIQAHEDFRMIATANTYGHGASRQYVGRNQLDAATLDRFAVLNWDIDENVEKALAGAGKDAGKWLATVRAVRAYVATEELRVVVSPRATQRGALLLEAGLEFKDVLGIALTDTFPAHAQSPVRKIAKDAWQSA